MPGWSGVLFGGPMLVVAAILAILFVLDLVLTVVLGKRSISLRIWIAAGVFLTLAGAMYVYPPTDGRVREWLACVFLSFLGRHLFSGIPVTLGAAKKALIAQGEQQWTQST